TLGLLNRALTPDHQLAADNLQVDRLEPDSCQLGLDDGLRRIAAVVDVYARGEPGLVPAGEPAALAPDIAEQLIHLATHALEVDQQVSVSCHGLSLATRVSDRTPASGPSDLVDGALVREVHRPAERLGALLAGPVRIELVRHVGEDHPSGAGAASVIAGLARRHVAAHAGALGARQRRLHNQQIGVPGDLDQLLARAAIGSVRESP